MGNVYVTVITMSSPLVQTANTLAVLLVLIMVHPKTTVHANATMAGETLPTVNIHKAAK